MPRVVEAVRPVPADFQCLKLALNLQPVSTLMDRLKSSTEPWHHNLAEYAKLHKRYEPFTKLSKVSFGDGKVHLSYYAELQKRVPGP